MLVYLLTRDKHAKSYEDDDFEAPIIGVGSYQSNARSAGKPKTVRQIGFVRQKVRPITARKKK